MENTKLDTYLVDVRAGIIKTRIVVIAAVVCIVLSIGICALIMSSGARKAAEAIRIIDRQGYTYDSQIIDERAATELQARAFLLTYFRLCYQFDTNNIQDNLNRAILLGDDTIAGYIELHSRPNGIYQAVRSMGRIARINEEQAMNNLVFAGNTFRTNFQQALISGTTTLRYNVSITGKIEFVTPSGIDNPNGFFITNYVENYRELEDYGN